MFLGVLGVASGLVTNSQAIIFDGMYSFVDVVPTVVSLLVVKLIARGTSHRFQYGFWHLEPLVAVLRDAILAVACIYAGIDALNALTSGGQEVEYGRAALWAGILCVIGLAMTVFLSRRAKALQSPMLKVDARSWVVSTFLSLGLLIGFAIATALAGTRVSRLGPLPGRHRAAQHGVDHAAHAADWFVALHERRTPGGA